MRKIKMDFETRSVFDLRKGGAYAYSTDPSTRVTCFSFKEIGASTIHLLDFKEMQQPWRRHTEALRLYWEASIENGDLFSAHNAGFERAIYNNVLVRRFGWPVIPLRQYRCTAAKAAAHALPRSLAGAGEALNLRTQKDPEGHRVMMKLCKPRKAWRDWNEKGKYNDGHGVLAQEPPKWWEPEDAPEDFAKLYAYCKQDVLAEEAVDLALPDLSPEEQEVWFHNEMVNSRGITIDTVAVEKILEMIAGSKRVKLKELDALSMGLIQNTAQRNAVLDFLRMEGVELPDLKAKTVEDFLKEGKGSADAKALLQIRKALSKSSTAKYNAFRIRTGRDRRLRDVLLYHAASTGRFGGTGVQPQNLPRGVVKDIGEAIRQIKNQLDDPLKLLYGEDLMPLFSSVIRGMFVASEKKVLNVGDWNAIETRVLWFLANHHQGLDIFNDGRDPYREMAAVIFGIELHEVDGGADDGPQRQLGKAVILGAGYQMGPGKFQTTCEQMFRLTISEELAKKAIYAYRNTHAPVPEFWKNLNLAAIFAIENPGRVYRVGKIKFQTRKVPSGAPFLYVRLPSGREIAYAFPKVVWAKMEWGSTIKQVEYMAMGTKPKKWKPERTYGGKLAENVVQAVARDLLVKALLQCEKEGFEVLMHSHDEITAESAPGGLDRFREIMEELPPWAEGLPLKAKVFETQYYRK